jgi:hypothetical protein
MNHPRIVIQDLEEYNGTFVYSKKDLLIAQENAQITENHSLHQSRNPNQQAVQTPFGCKKAVGVFWIHKQKAKSHQITRFTNLHAAQKPNRQAV